MLGWFKPKPKATAEQIKKDREVWLQEMLDASVRLKHLIRADNKGWREFCELVDDFITKSKQRKALTDMSRATEADIYELKLLDHDIYMFTWLMKIPEQFIKNVEAEVKKESK